MLFDHANVRPDEIAVDDLHRRCTWAELVDRSVRCGRMLQDQFGLRAGDRAAMVVGNRVEFLELQLGALLAGVWITPVNWHLTADEMAFIFDDGDAGLIVVDAPFSSTAHDAVRDRPVLAVGSDLEAAIADASDEPFAMDGPAGGTMFYTSGTTGRPKGVRRSTQVRLGDQLASYGAAGHALGLDGSGSHLVTGPLYHAAPVGFAVMDLHNGAPIVIMPKWDAEHCLDLIDARAVRNTHLVPTMFVRLLRLPDARRRAFSGRSLHTVLHGAAPVSREVKTEMISWWGPALVEYWGASEGGVVTLVGAEDWLAHPGTVGRPIPNHRVIVADPDSGEVLPTGEMGTLWCENRTVLDAYQSGIGDGRVFSYHNDEGKTAAASRAPGTYSIGDLGWVDEEGFVYLADRASHMIISGGVNIYPAEVEQVLAAHPSVADAAVFGIPDDEWGESVKAVVELVDGVDPHDDLVDEILAFARTRLAGFKVPRNVDFIEALPRHDSGKLYVRQLRDPYWEGRSRRI